MSCDYCAITKAQNQKMVNCNYELRMEVRHYKKLLVRLRDKLSAELATSYYKGKREQI